MVEKKSEQTAIGEVVDRLSRKYPMVPPSTIAVLVQEMHAKFDRRPVRDFVPLFVERNANTELRRLTS